jgi:Uma2 family endonuclease
MSERATEPVRWTVADLDLLPDDGTRYELVDGALFMTRAPHWRHQRTHNRIFFELEAWSMKSGLGVANTVSGLVFGENDSVIPDAMWISNERLATLLDPAGHLAGAPELVAEVISPGPQNELRDRQAKLKLYDLRGVQEYWIADWQLQQISIYRREEGRLRLAGTLLADDTLTSPLLPGFACLVRRLFE